MTAFEQHSPGCRMKQSIAAEEQADCVTRYCLSEGLTSAVISTAYQSFSIVVHQVLVCVLGPEASLKAELEEFLQLHRVYKFLSADQNFDMSQHFYKVTGGKTNQFSSI